MVVSWLRLPVLALASTAAGAAIVPAAVAPRDTNLVDLVLFELELSFAAAMPTTTANGTALLDTLLSALTDAPYTIPRQAADPAAREAKRAQVQANFVYNTSMTPLYPAGLLGDAKNTYDTNAIQVDLQPQLLAAQEDGTRALADAAKYGNLSSLDDYVQLYNGEWLMSLPNGPDAGTLTNYTQDRFFSMQRLANSPFLIRRLRANTDTLAFAVDDATATALTGTTLAQLLAAGRLFYADYRDQTGLEPTDGHYTALCDAYFFIDPVSGDFLPLAIRTNVGANLIYTPLDSAGDWTLAKIMLNVNDVWFTQWNHLAQSHYVVQPVWMAAVRTLSNEHPVFAILNRLTYESFSIQILADSLLFKPGTAVDLIFAFSGPSADNYTMQRYYGGAGNFRSNYFRTDLRARGLLDYCNGPALKHFPYYEDGAVIHDATHAFFDAFVRSFYTCDCDVALDAELQAWAAEANGPAGALDFPTSIASLDELVDILTHIAHLVSTAHQSVNTNELLQISGALPMGAPALYLPLPTEKSATTNPADFLPPLDKIVEQLLVATLFARPQFVGSNRTLIHMFDDAAMLGLMNEPTQEANADFVAAMEALSARIGARTFDADGLSVGMPALWKALDPNVAPYSLTV